MAATFQVPWKLVYYNAIIFSTRYHFLVLGIPSIYLYFLFGLFPRPLQLGWLPDLHPVFLGQAPLSEHEWICYIKDVVLTFLHFQPISEYLLNLACDTKHVKTTFLCKHWFCFPTITGQIVCLLTFVNLVRFHH